MNTVLDEMVLVPAPSGRLRKATAPPTESASAISVPPCSAPPAVVSRSCQRTVPTTVCGSAETSSRPRVVPSGINVLSASVVSSMPQFYRVARFAGT